VLRRALELRPKLGVAKPLAQSAVVVAGSHREERNT
jgi:hypothetical protein